MLLFCTFWDTANVYGDSEEPIGKWFKKTGRRDQIFLATKFGLVRDRPSKHCVDGCAKNVEESFNRTLQRLGVTYVDLYYLFIGESLSSLVDACFSQSNTSVSRNAVPMPYGAQALFNQSLLFYSSIRLLSSTPERNNVPKTSRELGIKIIAYSPLGRGLLTGCYISRNDFEERDFRLTIPRYSKENFPKILKLVEELRDVGKEYNATAGQVALAGEDIFPVPGTKKIKYLEENLAAARITLAPEAVQRVRAIAEEAVWDGNRYPTRAVSLLFGDTPPYNKTSAGGQRGSA